MYTAIEKLVHSSTFQNFIIGLIILNGITMGFETSKDIANTYHTFFTVFDTVVITIFTIEIVLRIYVHRISFFKDGWSLFDFFIVAISLIPTSGGLEILRILRVLRLLRLITVVPQMRKIVMALVSVIPGMLSIGALLTLLFYISAIIATQLYSETFPLWFGTLGESFYTLFQIMTLESWSMGIVRPIMEVHPLAWTFFIPFIFIVTFIMINLIIAIVVDAMTELTNEDSENIVQEIHHSDSHSTAELQQLRQEIAELKMLITASKSM
ncbi:MAG: ion transporter [Campylobacterota bacterium]|nr:ion transporter [Campylobacterota bacterium]